MPRIPDDELDRLKGEVSIERLLHARGVELKRVGKDLKGRCPFHGPDEDPSLSVDPGRNVFHCFGCGAKGSVVDLVMRLEGVSFRHAVEILLADYPSPSGRPPDQPLPKRSLARKLPLVVSPHASDGDLLTAVALYYHETAKRFPDPGEYLASRGLTRRRWSTVSSSGTRTGPSATTSRASVPPTVRACGRGSRSLG